ncbi:glycoside hydrolase family 3 protein [Brevundimonas diminuta]|jgi:beta-glucosidase|uniref:glycoside hydrolase family 3 protein n=1 Tax=Brevundimonas diminuta TaxID=293 RepID=UPI0035D941FD
MVKSFPSLTVLAVAAGLAGSAAAQESTSGRAALPASEVRLNLTDWPQAGSGSPVASRDAIERRVSEILGRMTLEEKVGQLLQPEILNITPDEVRQYHIGSVLNGGNGRPNRDIYAKPSEWLAMADAFYDASVDVSDGGEAIPIIWGTDSVHGNNSIFGGTIFPHNIGLGAANDPALMREIGRVTAVETAAMGSDWTFAPALSIPRDDRWGRTYEGFSEDPRIAGPLAAAYVEGLQGSPASDESFFAPGSIIATAKHYIADGGTQDGRDQGDAVMSEDDLRAIHFPPYVDTLKAGAQTVMASYSKWNGVRMHGHGPLMTELLKERTGFDGFIVGDFNGHALIPGCTNSNCPQAINAGLDMYMIPADWKALYANLLVQARDGTIPASRLDDAVRRILRVKVRAGLFEAGRPSERPFAGATHIGTAEHREVARRAARQSMVLLKNDPALLPFPADSKVLVAGAGADSVPMLVGGWSLNWQGTGLANRDFPGSVSVYAGLRQALEAGGGTATLSRDGAFQQRPDVAVVVFGETPYAEYQGDRESVIYKIPDEDPDLAVMRRLQAQGVPVVGVFLSGRPLWINPHLNASNAMIAAFLPGTQGGGALADLIVADADGEPRREFTGKLSFSWPRNAAQTALNVGDADYSPLFPYGWGLTVKETAPTAALSEDPGLSPERLAAASNSAFFQDGRALAPWRIYLGDAEEARLKTEGDRFVTSRSGAVRFESADRNRQEDTKLATWTGQGPGSLFVLGYSPIDFKPRVERNEAVVITAAVTRRPEGRVEAAFGRVGRHGAIDVTSLFNTSPAGEWRTFSIPLRCFAEAGAQMEAADMPLLLRTDRPFALQIASVRLAAAEGETTSCNR